MPATTVENTQTPSMYVRKEGEHHFTLRQERYKPHLAIGEEHPHDICAVAPDLETLEKMCSPHFPDVDYKNIVH